MCVQLEAEAATIADPDERAEMLEGFGLGEGALFRMVRSAYHLLGLRTFLTTGDKESRAWTFYAGSTAPRVRRPDPHRLPARLHPRRGDPLGRAARASARWTKAKELGKIRVEGKDYVVQRRRRHGVPLQRLNSARRPATSEGAGQRGLSSVPSGRQVCRMPRWSRVMR